MPQRLEIVPTVLEAIQINMKENMLSPMKLLQGITRSYSKKVGIYIKISSEKQNDTITLSSL